MTTNLHYHAKGRIKIGIALDGDAVLSVAEVGWPHQAAYFLAQSLALVPQVEAVCIVVPDATNPKLVQGILGAQFKVIPLAKALSSLHVLLDQSNWVPDQWVAAFRQGGGKVVRLSNDNPQVSETERMLFGRLGHFLSAARTVDAVWIPASAYAMAAAPLAVWARALVYAIPRLWSPVFIERQARQLPKGLRFSYRPGRAKWRLVVCESNHSLTSACHIPMLAAEAAYRQAPGLFEKLLVIDSFRLKTNTNFLNFAGSLKWVRDNKAFFEAHHTPAALLAQHAEVLLAHQWEGSMQYQVLEALYGAYPVVHNDEELRSFGYFYAGFDCEAAAAALLKAKSEHDANLPLYRSNTQQLQTNLDPKNPRNVAFVSRLLDTLFQPS